MLLPINENDGINSKAHIYLQSFFFHIIIFYLFFQFLIFHKLSYHVKRDRKKKKEEGMK